jgi:hypothetical protein
VLRAEGVLIDLRPASIHRLVGLQTAGRFRRLAVMREKFAEERAADRAVAKVVRHGLFKADARRRFPCVRSMDTLREFEEWLENAIRLSKWPRHDWLVTRLAGRLERARAATKIVVRGPMDLRVLRKMRPNKKKRPVRSRGRTSRAASLRS